jgi:hypothetical protein
MTPSVTLDPDQKYLVLAGGVLRLSDYAIIPNDPDNAEYIAYLDEVFPQPDVGLVTIILQQIMDAKAHSLNYDDIKTAITYADEPAVPKFQAEGKAFRAWRSLVWDAAYKKLAELQATNSPIPKFSELLPLIPKLQLPTE